MAWPGAAKITGLLKESDRLAAKVHQEWRRAFGLCTGLCNGRAQAHPYERRNLGEPAKKAERELRRE